MFIDLAQLFNTGCSAHHLSWHVSSSGIGDGVGGSVCPGVGITSHGRLTCAVEQFKYKIFLHMVKEKAREKMSAKGIITGF